MVKVSQYQKSWTTKRWMTNPNYPHYPENQCWFSKHENQWMTLTVSIFTVDITLFRAVKGNTLGLVFWCWKKTGPWQNAMASAENPSGYPKNGWWKSWKKPYFLRDDLGGKPTIFGKTPHLDSQVVFSISQKLMSNQPSSGNCWHDQFPVNDSVNPTFSIQRLVWAILQQIAAPPVVSIETWSRTPA